MSLFQSNSRKQIRNLPKILNFVKKIHYYSKLFTLLLISHAAASARAKHEWKCPHCGKPASVAVLVDDGLFQEVRLKGCTEATLSAAQNRVSAAQNRSIGQTLQGSFSAVSSCSAGGLQAVPRRKRAASLEALQAAPPNAKTLEKITQNKPNYSPPTPVFCTFVHCLFNWLTNRRKL